MTCRACNDTRRVFEPGRWQGERSVWATCLDCYDAASAALGHRVRLFENLQAHAEADALMDAATALRDRADAKLMEPTQ